MWKVNAKIETYTENATITPSRFGGWLAMNTGTAVATVAGYDLAPGEGLDFTNLQPDVLWNTPITIVLQAGASVRVTRLQYSKA